MRRKRWTPGPCVAGRGGAWPGDLWSLRTQRAERIAPARPSKSRGEGPLLLDHNVREVQVACGVVHEVPHAWAITGLLLGV